MYTPAHSLILGPSGYGKTTLAVQIAKAAAKRGLCALAYDENAARSGYGVEPWPQSCAVFDEWEPFYAAFWRSRYCLVFIDEGIDASREHRNELGTIFTKGRHVRGDLGGGGGHTCYLIGQTWMNLHATARKNTTQAFIFRLEEPCAMALKRKYNNDMLLDATRLEPLEYMHIDWRGNVSRHKIKF